MRGCAVIEPTSDSASTSALGCQTSSDSGVVAESEDDATTVTRTSTAHGSEVGVAAEHPVAHASNSTASRLASRAGRAARGIEEAQEESVVESDGAVRLEQCGGVTVAPRDLLVVWQRARGGPDCLVGLAPTIQVQVRTLLRTLRVCLAQPLCAVNSLKHASCAHSC